MNAQELLAAGHDYTTALIDDELNARQSALDEANETIAELRTQIAELEARLRPTLFGAYCGPDRYPNENPAETKAQMRARITELLGVLRVERIYNSSNPWQVPPAGTATILSFSANPTNLAAGNLDTGLDALLAGLKANGDECYLTVDHEADNDKYTGAEMVPAYQHVQARRDAIGATNVHVGPILMQWSVISGHDWQAYTFPGMDFLGFDAYFRPNGARTPATVYGPLVDAAESYGVPLVIGETSLGAQGTGGGFTAQEWSDLVPAAVDYLKGKAAAVAWFFTNKSDGDWRPTPYPDALAALRAACIGGA